MEEAGALAIIRKPSDVPDVAGVACDREPDVLPPRLQNQRRRMR